MIKLGAILIVLGCLALLPWRGISSARGSMLVDGKRVTVSSERDALTATGCALTVVGCVLILVGAVAVGRF